MRFIEMLPGLLTTAGQVYVASRRVPAPAQKPRQAARRRAEVKARHARDV